MTSLSSARAASSFNPSAIFGLGLATLSLCGAVWMLAGLVLPDRVPAGLANAHEARAGAALLVQPSTAATLDLAEDQSRAAVALAPMNGWSWLRLAYIDQVRHGGPTQVGLDHLQRSFDVAPYGPQVTSWRITFALDNWATLTPALRREISSEIAASWPLRGKTVDAAVAKSTSRAGRLAAQVIIERIKLENAGRWTSATP